MICNMICKRENSSGCDSLAGGDPYPSRQQCPSAPVVRVPPTSAGSALRSKRAAKSAEVNGSGPESMNMLFLRLSGMNPACLKKLKMLAPTPLTRTQCVLI